MGGERSVHRLDRARGFSLSGQQQTAAAFGDSARMRVVCRSRPLGQILEHITCCLEPPTCDQRLDVA
jgi:hypothetical protein